MTLSEAELERYSRQLVMPEWSSAAQERLRSASAVVVGAGALGCPAATYLVAAGIGRIEGCRLLEVDRGLVMAAKEVVQIAGAAVGRGALGRARPVLAPRERRHPGRARVRGSLRRSPRRRRLR